MNYLILLRRADFIDLYKYGFLNVNKEKIVPFDCSIPEIESKPELYDSIFAEINSFESSFAYLILHYEKKDSLSNPATISIEEVQHIFPLDLEAKKEFESSFDEHIRIDNPIWDNAVSLIQKRQMFDSSMQGTRNIFNIFKLEGLQFCKSIIDDISVEEMLSDVYDNIRPNGDKPIWTYLMRYERHSFYPKDTLGFYMDVVHVICNFMAKREVDDYEVEGTAIYKILDSYNGLNLKSNDINDRLRLDERASGFLQKISEFVPDVDFISVAINYLVMRERFSDDFTYDQEFVERCKASFGQSFTLASYMLGIALTHDKTYSCLYENLPLPIYKSQAEMQRIKMQKEYEKEKAKREMQRMEDEREREKMMRSEFSRGQGKKKKKSSYNPYGKSSYPYDGSSGSYGYGKRYEGSYSPFQGQEQSPYKPPFHEDVPNIVQEPTPSTKGGKKIKVESPSLFGTDENRVLITVQKYTSSGKPSKAKDAIRDVTEEEFELLKNSKDDWRIVKK